MLTGVVHKDKDGTIWFDDLPVRGPEDIPRRRAWRGTLWYATPGISSADWARLMGPMDEAFGPSPGTVLGLKFRLGKRSRMTVLDASAWGVSTIDPNRSHERLRAMMLEAHKAGIKVKNSIAATAVNLYMDRFDGQDGRPLMRQLPSQWRAMAHSAMHGGPIAVLRASAPFAVHIDVKNAYLAALYDDVPVVGVDADGNRVGGWYTHSDPRWVKVRKLVGFVDCTVRVREDLHPATLPPLAVHLRSGSVYARGKLRGCWTISQVREAEERSEVEVLEVHQFCFAPQTRPLFAEIADLFNELPGALGKRLYTRFWGKFGSRGGYNARRCEEPQIGEVPAAGLWWRFDGVALDSHRARPTYRPDVAAFVCASNHNRVLASFRQLKPDSVIACHVDAIWTTDLVGAARLSAAPDKPGVWRTKRSGPVRFYGTGCYAHGDGLAAQGYDARVHGPLTKERLETWISGASGRKLLLDTRRWTGDPAVDPKATSRSLNLDMDTDVSPTEGPTVYDPRWSMGGWLRQDDPDADESELPSSNPDDPLGESPPAYVGAAVEDSRRRYSVSP